MKEDSTPTVSVLGRALGNALATAWIDYATMEGHPLDVQLRIGKEELEVEVVNYETGEVLECTHWR